MLTLDEQAMVIQLLVQSYAALPSPRQSLCAALKDTDFPALLPEDPLPPSLIRQALRICIEHDSRHRPAWLVELLANVPQVPELGLILARLQAPLPPVSDPLDAILLANGMPFLNRADLRQRLRVLSDPKTLKPILVVNGPRKGGKSYSLILIDHFCGNHDGILHGVSVLQPGQEKITGPIEVAKDLALISTPPYPMPPEDHTNPDRWLRELAIWVLSTAVNEEKDGWLVLDGFTGPDVNPDVRKLIVHLADLVTKGGRFARRCRLILLDFDATVLAAVPPGKILIETIKAVQPYEIEACIEAILERYKPPLTSADLRSKILPDLPTNEERLPELQRRIWSVMEEVGSDV